jgi:hypothetical protein
MDIHTQIPMAAADVQLDNMRVDGATVSIVVCMCAGLRTEVPI